MLITAVNKLTLVDYPGQLAAIIFTGGCNIRCGYCHNADFVLPERLEKIKNSFIPFEAVKNFLESRKGLLDAVVFCGGEPTLQSDLIEKCKEVKAMGFKVKVDTNGLSPETIQKLLNAKAVDYFAMDLKSSLDESYSKITGTKIDTSKLQKSIQLIQNSGVDYEFRSTILPDFHTKEVLEQMAKTIKGSPLWALQNFRNKSTLDKSFEKKSGFTKQALEEIQELVKPYVKRVEIRS